MTKKLKVTFEIELDLEDLMRTNRLHDMINDERTYSITIDEFNQHLFLKGLSVVEDEYIG